MKSSLTLLALLVLLACPPAPHAHADDPADDDRGTIVELSFEKAPIGKVIEALARYSGRNVIVAPDVQGTATVKLSKMHWRQAFDLIADAHGLDVEHRAGNVTIVRKGKGNAKAEAKRRRAAADAETVEAARRRADLESEISASKKRIAELEHEIARTAAKGAFVERAKLEDAPVLVQIHAVGDLVKERKTAVQKLVKKHALRGTTVKWHGTNLVVRGSKDEQNRLARDLSELRTKLANDFVVISRDGKARRARLVKAEDDIKRLEDRRAKAEAEMAAGKTRIENLARALEHLKKAGARGEAERIAVQIDQARNRQAQARARLAELARAMQAARDQVDRVEAGRIEVEKLRFRAPSKAVGGVEGLRHEVRALRGEVRNLTVLVKKLLELHGAKEAPRRRARSAR